MIKLSAMPGHQNERHDDIGSTPIPTPTPNQKAASVGSWMIPDHVPPEHAKILRAAQRWYDRQIAASRQALGPAWPALEAWVTEYLREQLKRSLIEKYGFRERHDG